jgi:hypothetical protein
MAAGGRVGETHNVTHGKADPELDTAEKETGAAGDRPQEGRRVTGGGPKGCMGTLGQEREMAGMRA